MDFAQSDKSSKRQNEELLVVRVIGKWSVGLLVVVAGRRLGCMRHPKAAVAKMGPWVVTRSRGKREDGIIMGH